MRRYDFGGRILKVHHDKFMQTYSPSPLSAFRSLSLSSSVPNSAYPFSQGSSAFSIQQQLGKQYFGQELHGRIHAEQTQNLGTGLLAMQVQIPQVSWMLCQEMPLHQAVLRKGACFHRSRQLMATRVWEVYLRQTCRLSGTLRRRRKSR